MQEVLHFPLVLMNRHNKTESAVFLYCRFSVFLKDPFFQIIYVLLLCLLLYLDLYVLGDDAWIS